MDRAVSLPSQPEKVTTGNTFTHLVRNMTKTFILRRIFKKKRREKKEISVRVVIFLLYNIWSLVIADIIFGVAKLSVGIRYVSVSLKGGDRVVTQAWITIDSQLF